MLALAFVQTERRAGEGALTPPALFGSPRLVGLNLATLLLYGALGGFLLLLPYRLIEAGGYPATAAGAALLPLPLVMMALSPVTGDLAGRLGARRLLIVRRGRRGRRPAPGSAHRRAPAATGPRSCRASS